MDLKDKLKDKLKELVELKSIIYKSTNDLSNKINYYIAFSSALLLIYIFNNLDILRSIELPKWIQFLIVLIPLLNSFFSLLMLYLNLKNDIIIVDYIDIISNLIEEKISGIDTPNEDYKLKEKIEKKQYLFQKISDFVEYIIFALTVLTFIEIAYIFYLLIYKHHYSILIKF